MKKIAYVLTVFVLLFSISCTGFKSEKEADDSDSTKRRLFRIDRKEVVEKEAKVDSSYQLPDSIMVDSLEKLHNELQEELY